MGRKKTSKTYEEAVREWQKKHPQDRLELSVAIPWCIDNGLLAGQVDIVRWHIERASNALQHSQRKKDRARNWHSVTEEIETGEGKPVQRTFWGHLDDAPSDFLQTSVEQRLKQLVRDGEAIERDIGAIKEKHPETAAWLSQRLLQYRANGASGEG